MYSLSYILSNITYRRFFLKQNKSFKLYSRLHVLRAEKRITQQELADAVGVTRGTIVSIEKGNYNPSLELAFKLSQYFSTSIESIFSYSEDSQ